MQLHASEIQSLNINKIIMVAQNDVPAVRAIQPSVPDVPMGQGPESRPNLLPENAQNDKIDKNLFGLPGGGYVHPFLSVAGEYTDNLFNVNENEKSNFLTTLTPGIWLAAPQLKEVPIAILTNNTSAGGLQMAIPDYKGFDRFNTYLLGSTDFKYYSEDSELNDNGARLEGLFKYNLRSGLSFRVLDSFNRGQDRFDAGSVNSIDKLRQYNSNIALADINWAFSEKFKTKVEYSNFLLDYQESSVDFLNRSDNTGSIYGFYKYSVKTALFLQYQHMDISYDSSSARDNTQDFIYGGIDWKSTDKTTLNFKLGYQDRQFKDEEIDNILNSTSDSDNGALALELALQYQIREKSKLTFMLNRKIDESDSYLALSKEILGGNIRYEQQFTEKLQGLCDFSYENADYNQVLDYDREDDRFIFRPALQYIFREWLMVELAYQFDTRDSSDELYDYHTNSIALSLNLAL